ncbi:hypothetical protein [Sulfitobacter sp. 20_GPM-1509m]|uniref:hypothetical protein n=1 Tax=Sulfitobacter sp. 20_GPM-1509m TaxID=1380367 RepID=UPI001C30BA00|nr:hypothetical protein [Sulfitobacter sp. 20_GPM-1509m]
MLRILASLKFLLLGATGMEARSIRGLIAGALSLLFLVLVSCVGNEVLKNPSTYGVNETGAGSEENAATVEAVENEPYDVERVLSLAENINTSQTTLLIGVFVLLGFSLSRAPINKLAFSPTEYVALALFLFASYLFFYCSYWVRTDLLGSLSVEFETERYARSAFLYPREIFSNMAVLLGLAYSAALVVVVSRLSADTQTTPKSENPKPETTTGQEELSTAIGRIAGVIAVEVQRRAEEGLDDKIQEAIAAAQDVPEEKG